MRAIKNISYADSDSIFTPNSPYIFIPQDILSWCTGKSYAYGLEEMPIMNV